MNWLRKLMLGRNGLDQLSIALLTAYFLLSLAAELSKLRFFNIAGLILLLLSTFRIFSSNLAKRYEENRKFLTWWNPAQNWINSKIQRIYDRKTYRYFNCPTCKQKLRVPKGKGKIKISCPKCKKEFLKKS